ncbi:unnamed protein product [Caenorhabditis bovis]|uniref:Uncharacterized protein n=1 Tax=Caenorhabditis bovis TaxID=2654633 RepID=A0A8S1F0E2_9PELO|nr:unnamed protein product [Caenorhabditis bovis]
MMPLLILILTPLSTAEPCKPIHAQAHGVNLVCCSLNQSLIPSCEYSSLCRDICTCSLTISRDLDCIQSSNSITEPYEWKDHQPNSVPLECNKPNLPNAEAPYSIMVENADGSAAYNFLLGACNANVTSITFQDYNQLFDTIDFSACFPNLMSFQIVLLQRKQAIFTKSLKSLQNLDTLSLVNIDFEFWHQTPAFSDKITYLHVENSSMSEIPKWLAKCGQLKTVYLKNTRASSLTAFAQLPRVRFLKLSHNLFANLHHHVFASPDLIHVDLSENRIGTLATHTFAKCTEIRVMDLSGNPIKMLSYKSFAKNSKLKWLKLSRTNITNLTPDHFHGLTSLKTLSMSKVPLQSISNYAFLPLKSLRYLDLDSCNLTRIPHAVTFNCHLTRLNVANNLFHRSSSLPPEVLSVLSGLAQLRLDGNPLTEFPPSLLLISRENMRLLRHLLHTSMTLPMWSMEPCTPYYWAMHITNRTTTLRSFLAQYDETKMKKRGFGYCKDQFEWIMEQMDIYRELEKTNGCTTQRRLRSSHNFQKETTTIKPEVLSHKIDNIYEPHFQTIPQLLLASLIGNLLLIFTLLICLCMACACNSSKRE